MEPISPQEEGEVQRVMRWLLPGDPFGRAASRLLIGYESDVPAQELSHLLRSGRGWWRRRWLSAWLLGRTPLSPEDRNGAVSCLLSVAAKRPSNPSGCLAAAGCFTGPLMLPVWLAAFVFSITARRANAVRAAAVDSLGRLDARSALATFLAVTQENPRIYPAGGHKDLREAMTRSLPRVLALVCEADYGQLPSMVTPALAVVAQQAPEPVALAALGALERAGDGRAVEIVDRLARRRRRSPVRDAAQRALAALLPRLERERQAALLLRPAMSPDSPSEILLRPAGGPPADDQPLLRPAMPPLQKEEETTSMHRMSGSTRPACDGDSEFVRVLPGDNPSGG